MEILIVIIAALALFLPQVLKNKLKPRLQKIITMIAGVLLVAMVWLSNTEGIYTWKIIISILVIGAIYNSMKNKTYDNVNGK